MMSDQQACFFRDNFLIKLNNCRNEINSKFKQISENVMIRQNQLLAELDGIENKYSESQNTDNVLKQTEKYRNEQNKGLQVSFLPEGIISSIKLLIKSLNVEIYNLRQKLVAFTNIDIELDTASITTLIDKLGSVKLTEDSEYNSCVDCITTATGHLDPCESCIAISTDILAVQVSVNKESDLERQHEETSVASLDTVAAKIKEERDHYRDQLENVSDKFRQVSVYLEQLQTSNSNEQELKDENHKLRYANPQLHQLMEKEKQIYENKEPTLTKLKEKNAKLAQEVDHLSKGQSQQIELSSEYEKTILFKDSEISRLNRRIYELMTKNVSEEDKVTNHANAKQSVENQLLSSEFIFEPFPISFAKYSPLISRSKSETLIFKDYSNSAVIDVKNLTATTNATNIPTNPIITDTTNKSTNIANKVISMHKSFQNKHPLTINYQLISRSTNVLKKYIPILVSNTYQQIYFRNEFLRVTKLSHILDPHGHINHQVVCKCKNGYYQLGFLRTQLIFKHKDIYSGKQRLYGGVEFDEAIGDSNGTLQGTFYFLCKPNCGLFCLAEEIFIALL